MIRAQTVPKKRHVLNVVSHHIRKYEVFACSTARDTVDSSNDSAISIVTIP